MKNNNLLENRATSSGKLEETYCQNCEENLVFGMKDNYHEFSLGLTTVLECLLVAEKEAFLPELPSEWWVQVVRTYPKLANLRYRE